jgi:hypothetical protein
MYVAARQAVDIIVSRMRAALGALVPVEAEELVSEDGSVYFWIGATSGLINVNVIFTSSSDGWVLLSSDCLTVLSVTARPLDVITSLDLGLIPGPLGALVAVS